VVTDPPGDRDAEVATLRKENAELRRANEILKTASAFFAATDWPAYSTSNSTP
jgi:transposase-like protein